MLTYLPQSQNRYRRDNAHPYRLRLERRWMTLKQRRRRFWLIFHALWLFAFLEFAVKVGEVALFLMIHGPESGLQVELPEARSAQKLAPRSQRINIWIDADDRVVIDDITTKSGDEIAELLYAKWHVKPHHKPVIHADRHADMVTIKYVQKILDIAGYDKVYFRTYGPNLLRQ